MASLNKVYLVGNLAKDIELKQTTSGIDTARITIATNKVWKDKEGNKQEKAQFHNVVLWRHSARFAHEYCGKWDLVLVEWEIEYRSWDKDDGTKWYATEIVADKFELLKSRGISERDIDEAFPEEAPAPREQKPKAKYPQDDIDISDIPF